ncbi:MAG TPA: hypothetical protein VG889_13775 [Rhizomicrobium sp.]|nr:hypothetical protein [Rhizomicrobium sp.]
MSNPIAIAALIMSAASFVVYLITVWQSATAKLGQEAHVAAGKALQQAEAVSVDQLTDLLKAVSGVADSLAKAGPSLTSIVASVLFLAIAAFGGGS